jgi:geranylgeranyl pyrophosphate synthase
MLCALRGLQRREVAGLVHALGSADPDQAWRIRDQVVTLVRASGALATARSLADRWSMEAVACLAPLRSGPRARLEEFANRLTLRDS